MRRETLECHPPFFLEDFLSGTDFGGYGLIVVQFWLGRDSVHRVLSRKSRTIWVVESSVALDSRSGLIMGDLEKDFLFEPIKQVVTRALRNLQAQFRSGLQLFLVYRGADRCEDAKH